MTGARVGAGVLAKAGPSRGMGEVLFGAERFAFCAEEDLERCVRFRLPGGMVSLLVVSPVRYVCMVPPWDSQTPMPFPKMVPIAFESLGDSVR